MQDSPFWCRSKAWELGLAPDQPQSIQSIPMDSLQSDSDCRKPYRQRYVIDTTEVVVLPRAVVVAMVVNRPSSVARPTSEPEASWQAMQVISPVIMGETLVCVSAVSVWQSTHCLVSPVCALWQSVQYCGRSACGHSPA